MPDLSMCDHAICPKAKTCYRFTASPNVWRQSYFSGAPYQKGEDCKYFWLDERTEKQKELDEERYQRDLKSQSDYFAANPKSNLA